MKTIKTTNAEAKKRSNDRKRERGLIPKQVWIHKDDNDKFDKHLKRMNNKRGL